jgi:hypothetical protein
VRDEASEGGGHQQHPGEPPGELCGHVEDRVPAFYLDSTPTHSDLKYLYKYPQAAFPKYPQAAFPYAGLVEANRGRDRHAPGYELMDTGVLDADRYFDVVVEYAQAAPDDILIRITATNRGPEPAEIHLLPTLWFRNTWSWDPATPRPALRAAASGDGQATIEAEHETLGSRWLYCQGAPPSCSPRTRRTRNACGASPTILPT